jgi:hypothetical protein
MKAGFEDRNKVYAVIGLLVVAAFLFFRVFNSGGNSTVSAASAPNAALTTESNAPASASRRGGQPPPNLDPSLRTSALKAVESQEYKGSGRNIFEYAQAPIPQPKTDILKPPPPPPPCPPNCPPPPPPPPIPLKFYGFASRPGEPTRIFLSEGEDIFIGGEGEIVNRRYKILHIGKTSVEIEDTLNNNRQTIPLTQG